MSRGPTKNQYSQGLSYVAQKPKFLQNFGKAPSPPPRDDRAGSSRGGDAKDRGPGGSRAGREPLPERPSEGEWAQGSDEEDEVRGKGSRKRGEEEDDEWGEVYGGSEDGPQVVVLKAGRHLTAEDVKRERRRAAGRPSQSPPPPSTKLAPPSSAISTAPDRNAQRPTKPQIPKPNTAKRKLVGEAVTEAKGKSAVVSGDMNGTGGGGGDKKKKKAGKGLLSFDDAEGES